MGLDCTAYSNVVVLPGYEDGFDEWPDIISPFVNPDFPLTSRGLIAGTAYDTTKGKSVGWRAGSYSGYNRWRESIAAIGGYTTTDCWAEPEKYKEFPFFELVNFSDCEGAIGNVVCNDLLADFIEYRDRYRAVHDDWWSEVYDEWIEGLTLAADNGILELH